MAEAIIIVRAIHFAAVVSVCGLVAFLVFVGTPATLRRSWLGIGCTGLVVAVASGAAWLGLFAARLADQPEDPAAVTQTVGLVLGDTRFGHVWCARLVLAALIGLLLCRIDKDCRWRSPAEAWAALTLAAGFAGSLVFAGHGGAGGPVQLAADLVHLLAASAWVGGLLPLALLLAHAMRVDDAPSLAAARLATWRFSSLGIVAVIAVMASGLVNTWFLLGGPAALVDTAYGRLLACKLALVAAMLALAMVNRLRLAPRLDPPAEENLRRLRRNTLIEAALGLAVLGVVAVLGSLPPAAHNTMH